MSLLHAGLRALAKPLNAEQSAAGASRANPAPLNTETAAGPWKLTMLQIQTGDAATASVTQASQFNVAPPDGTSYVVIQLRAQNASNREYDIEPDDFGVTGSSGVLHRFSQQLPPAPALHATVKAGDSVEGWIVAEVNAGETSLLLVYDSVSITGSWSDCVFALEDGGAIADAGAAAAAKNDAGAKPGSAAGVGDEVVTDEWAVKLLDIVAGQDVIGLYPQSDYRTTALLGGDPKVANVWLAIHLQITNVRTGGARAFLPPTSFLLAASDGAPVDDVRLLTPPEPDASGTYYPGGSRDGWVAFEVPSSYGDGLVRFLPFVTDSDTRFLNYGGGGGAPAAAPSATVAAGAKVTVSEDTVNLRAEASTGSIVVVELKKGDVLTVTGAAVAGGDYDWYPVTVDASGQTGFIAVNFVQPAG